MKKPRIPFFTYILIAILAVYLSSLFWVHLFKDAYYPEFEIIRHIEQKNADGFFETVESWQVGTCQDIRYDMSNYSTIRTDSVISDDVYFKRSDIVRREIYYYPYKVDSSIFRIKDVLIRRRE